MHEDFDHSAKNYLVSSDHKTGEDLEYLKNYFRLKKFKYHLDIATAAGHFTKIFKSDFIFGLDTSMNMLKTASETYNILPLRGRSEYLPFKENSFDLVTCRIAMHHFENPENFFEETSRVIGQHGVFVLVDSIVDTEDAYLNEIEYFRDNSHIRSYTVSEVLDLNNSELRLVHFNLFNKKHNFYEWGTRLGADNNKLKRLEQKFLNLPEKIKKVLDVKIVDGKVKSYMDKKGLFIFEKI